MKALLTGFEPFNDYKINPSVKLAKEFHNCEFYSVNKKLKVVGEEISLNYTTINSSIQSLIKKTHPDFIFMLGQAPRTCINIERVAINVASAKKTAYNCGTKPFEEPININGPPAYFSSLDIVKIVDIWKNKGIPAKISNTAGTFGCNQIFYAAMDFVNRESTINRTQTQVGFIHVPLLPEQVVEKPHLFSMSYEIMKQAIELLFTEYILENF